MAGRSIEERLAETERRIKQLEAQKLALERKLKEKQRKERTRRLIQIGGIWAHMGFDTLEQHQRLQRYFESNPHAMQKLRDIANGETDQTEPAAQATEAQA